MFDVSVEQETTSKPPAIRWKAIDASKTRLLVRQMHKRIPAWKLKLCVEALNARPIDHARISEVTEIQFVNEELVDVAAQCLVDIAKESESVTSSGKDVSHKQADEQCATAQNSSKPTSSTAVLTLDATASPEKSTSEYDDES